MLMQTLSALKGTQCRGMYTCSLLEVSKPCKPEALATTSKKLLWEVLHYNSMASSQCIACVVITTSCCLKQRAQLSCKASVIQSNNCVARLKEQQSQRRSSPSDVRHLLLLADIDLEVIVPLVDTHDLILIHLVTCSTEELAPLLDALQGI